MHTENAMPSSAPIVALNPQVREAFDEAWLAIFETRVGASAEPAGAAQYLARFRHALSTV